MLKKFTVDEERHKSSSKNAHRAEKVFIGHSVASQVMTVKVTSDGDMLLSGGYDEKVILWDIEKGHVISECATKSKVESVAIVPGEQGKPLSFFVSGHDDNMAKLWKVVGSEMELIHCFEGHTGIIKKVAVHPRKPIMATASLDNTWKLWSLEDDTTRKNFSFRLIYTSHDKVCHDDDVTSVEFSPDGNYLISGSEDASMCVEDLIHHLQYQPSSLQRHYFKSDLNLWAERPELDWNEHSNAMVALNATPRRIVEPHWDHDMSRNIIHVAASKGRHNFLRAALLIKDDKSEDIPIKDDTGDIIGHRATGWEGRQKLAFFAAVGLDKNGKSPLALAIEAESAPAVRALLECYSELLSEKYASEPFYTQDTFRQVHPSELFPFKGEMV